jgi:Protein of unknown function DUF2617
VRTTLDVPYADSRAAQLSWQLGPACHQALAEVPVALPGGALDLRLLGGSHQVLLSLDGTRCSEVVACGSGVPGLPAAIRRTLPGLRYRFRSAVSVLSAAALAAEVERLLARLADDPAALVGEFPGSRHAVTALLAEPRADGVTWRTWHAYPQSGELVTTVTDVDRR